ncbi:MAG: RNA methyltransferase [Gammaproteobacteria bacterium]|nr:RNA methyltransferase [Gammaproteobacteria bacterium]
MFDVLNKINIVLVESSHPGNIGAAARAMKTMGLNRLSLVNPVKYPCAEATARASGADDVLATARVFESLDQALAESSFVIGTSARERRLQWPNLGPDAAAMQLLQHAVVSEVALVFGREKYGLTNEELARCQALVTIDANPAYSSLNLASAVQIMTYELRRQILRAEGVVTETAEAKESLATAAELEGMYGHLEQTLSEIGVIKTEQPKAMLMRRLRRLFNRTQLSGTEVNILRGILSAAQGRKRDRSK